MLESRKYADKSAKKGVWDLMAEKIFKTEVSWESIKKCYDNMKSRALIHAKNGDQPLKEFEKVILRTINGINDSQQPPKNPTTNLMCDNSRKHLVNKIDLVRRMPSYEQLDTSSNIMQDPKRERTEKMHLLSIKSLEVLYRIENPKNVVVEAIKKHEESLWETISDLFNCESSQISHEQDVELDFLGITESD